MYLTLRRRSGIDLWLFKTQVNSNIHNKHLCEREGERESKKGILKVLKWFGDLMR